MPDHLLTPDALPIELGDAIAQLSVHGFNPDCPDSVAQGAEILAGLFANRGLLTPALTAALDHHAVQDAPEYRYTGQTIELGGNAASGCMIRANIWPAADDPLMQRPIAEGFQYGFAHDHNFDFLTIGYHGPGYRSDFFAYDYESTIGFAGEEVTLTSMDSITLAKGKMLHYRAGQDVHRQWPPDALSISLNIVHVHSRQSWFDQYGFDVQAGRISRIVSHSSLEALLTIAPYCADENARDVAAHIMAHHVSDAVRLTAAHALATWQNKDGNDSALFWQDCGRLSSSPKIQAYAKAQLAAHDTPAL
jgi:hypothetical protein